MLKKSPQDMEAWTTTRLDELDALEQERRTDRYDEDSLLAERSYSLVWKRQLFRTPRKPGRPPGGERAVLSFACKHAVQDLERIRGIWKQYQIKRGKPSALEIAAARNKIDPDTLINFLKNHPKLSRSK